MNGLNYTCSKIFTDFPFAHRQHLHDGHCAIIHGHNWSFEFQFACRELDENGFVVDFGKLKWMKQWLEKHFDHTLVLNEDDPHLKFLHQSFLKVATIVLVPNCGAEGLAHYTWNYLNIALMRETKRRVWISTVTVHEDSKNKATYRNDVEY